MIVVDGKARLLEDHAENCAPSSQQELERNMLRASSKRKAAESLDSRPAKVLRRCLGESGYENIEIRDTKLVRRILVCPMSRYDRRGRLLFIYFRTLADPAINIQATTQGSASVAKDA